MEFDVSLELDHIDGDPTNNEKSNLRFLCPNCHATTDTYRSKNKNKNKNNYAPVAQLEEACGLSPHK